jgi:hypothetical protein
MPIGGGLATNDGKPSWEVLDVGEIPAKPGGEHMLHLPGPAAELEAPGRPPWVSLGPVTLKAAGR